MEAFYFGHQETRQSLKKSFESLFVKYDHEFQDDDEIDLLSMKITKNGKHLDSISTAMKFGELFHKYHGNSNQTTLKGKIEIKRKRLKLKEKLKEKENQQETNQLYNQGKRTGTINYKRLESIKIKRLNNNYFQQHLLSDNIDFHDDYIIEKCFNELWEISSFKKRLFHLPERSNIQKINEMFCNCRSPGCVECLYKKAYFSD